MPASLDSESDRVSALELFIPIVAFVRARFRARLRPLPRLRFDTS